MDIANHKVIVVGGSSGMGRAVAQAAAAKGAEVTIVGRSQVKLAEVVAELAAPQSVRTIAADVTNEDDVRRIFATTGAFDHLIVTAASNLAYSTLQELDQDAIRRTIDAKLIAALLLVKYAAPHINERGSITLTSGIAAERPLSTGFLVAAVNGSLFSLTYGLAVALAPVRVNVLSPGWVDTPIWRTSALAANRESMFEKMVQRLPARRIGQPEDIAHAAIFLMENEFTTGAILPIDGGHRLI
ncbi:MAG TPA: SDR family oxidoreductase [Ktedonobacteraceae bacterium]|nr:SDR family oxidoreductase [Ktedonobacteraceae bacterium]